MAELLEIGGRSFAPGSRGVIRLDCGRDISHKVIDFEVHVIRGREPGPCVFVSAGIHGDEINGIEICRRLLRSRALGKLSGDLIVTPIVNVPAFVARSRYLPDRRDLNRLFPGSEDGSFGSRIARLFTTEIVANCDYGIDLHTGASNRTNLPQVRTDFGIEGSRELAAAFGAPVVLAANKPPEGSLRHACSEQEVLTMVYEAGESMRLDVPGIRFAQGLPEIHGLQEDGERAFYLRAMILQRPQGAVLE